MCLEPHAIEVHLDEAEGEEVEEEVAEVAEVEEEVEEEVVVVMEGAGPRLLPTSESTSLGLA